MKFFELEYKCDNIRTLENKCSECFPSFKEILSDGPPDQQTDRPGHRAVPIILDETFISLCIMPLHIIIMK